MPVEWNRVKFFKREEWVHDPDRVSPDLVYLVDELRAAAGAPIMIHVAFDPDGHVADSGHYTTARDLAVAVDFHIVGWSLLRQWLHVERFPFMGVGLYPSWNTPGLHVDLRRVGREHGNLGRRWWRDAQGVYQPLTAAFIRQIANEASDI